MKEVATTHGGTGTHAFNIWRGMRDRCELESHKSFPNYGGRGIRVCTRWSKSFEDFVYDMGQPPSHLHSIERNNVNGDYEPGNCTWATMHQQARNKRTNVFYEFKNKSLVIKDLAVECGIPEQTLYNRLRRGLSVAEATRHGRAHRISR